MATTPNVAKPEAHAPIVPKVRFGRLLIVAAIFVLIAYFIPHPPTVTPAGWRATGVFIATIAGFMLQPLPASPMVLIGVTTMIAVKGAPMARVLAGYSTPSVWLMVISILIARAIIDSGLARRIALLFIRAFGHSSLGIAYALSATEITLSAGITISARSGGIVLPITKSIAELYNSHPGDNLLGRFLMTSVYQSSAVACAMFITSQVSNVIAAGLAKSTVGVTVTATSWFIAGLVPGLVSALLVPWICFRMMRPEIVSTPGAAQYAMDQLKAMGPMRGKELVTLWVFAGVALLWLTSQWTHLDITLVAFGGICVFFLTGVLDWTTALKEGGAWDILTWYGGLYAMAEILNEVGSSKAFANWIGSNVGQFPWYVALGITLLGFFYVHYGFASISAHILALYAPFLATLVALGTPAGLAVYALGCLANLTAGLTHYGTTTGPMYFATRYVGMKEWWRVGFVISIVNLLVWTTVGFGWWKLIGIW
jgi:DASS family divalent anion:Na+ symporter